MSGFVQTSIADRTDWSSGLMTLTLESSQDFVPGQFLNLGLKRGETVIRRSYSIASAPKQRLQFLLSRVEGGELTPALFDLALGDQLFIDPTPLGFFTLNEVPETKKLWLVSTGTGLGPYLSMLRASTLFERFEQIYIIHGVRHESQLAHRQELMRAARESQKLRYIPLLSGLEDEIPPQAIVKGRITDAWDNGQLEAIAGAFDQDCHMLICGNPQMIEDMTTRLKDRGFEKHRRRQPGHFNFEKYW